MLDFIVLGLVPGTTIQLGFKEVMQLNAIVICFVIIARQLYKQRKDIWNGRFINKWRALLITLRLA